MRIVLIHEFERDDINEIMRRCNTANYLGATFDEVLASRCEFLRKRDFNKKDLYLTREELEDFAFNYTDALEPDIHQIIDMYLEEKCIPR